jgi:hypothetical protein
LIGRRYRGQTFKQTHEPSRSDAKDSKREELYDLETPSVSAFTALNGGAEDV